MVSRWAADGPPWGAEETPSTMQSRDAERRGARAPATEQKRDVRQPDGEDPADGEEVGGGGETADPAGCKGE